MFVVLRVEYPHMFLRTTKTASGATAVQVVRYSRRKRIIVRHIGSVHTPEELASLKQTGIDWIEQETKQQRLFPSDTKQAPAITPIEKCAYLDTRYSFIYDVLSQLLRLLHFDKLNNQLLLDLVLIRIIEPVSKLESLEYLSEMFGITYKRGKLYQTIASFPQLKPAIEKKTVAFAKQNLSFNFSIVFYDVTTLYFETSKEDTDKDSLRKSGFSKDNKPNQPQIVIGLIVTKEGFPVSYDIFAGNTFEGKTFIPAITKFKDTYKVRSLTVVADAAMISFDNVQQLVKKNLSYIVGARLANLTLSEMKHIHAVLIGQRQSEEELQKIDGAAMRMETERGLLICDFSFKRRQKDTWDMEKQIAKAEKLLREKEGLKRTKFLMNKDKKKTEQILNIDLIEKTQLLLGIKGYYANLVHETNETIITHYHNLWHVEKAFRIAKSDLQMRPVYHFKQQTIEAHILICFMALAVCKYMELKTGKSTKKIVKLLKSITEARMKNLLTDKVFVMRKELPQEVKQLREKLLL